MKIHHHIRVTTWDYQSKLDDFNFGTPPKETMDYLAKETTLITTVSENYYSNRFGPPEKNHIYLPFFNLVDVTTSNNLSKENYWTKIHKVNKKN